jgi:hypothetical protein
MKNNTKFFLIIIFVLGIFSCFLILKNVSPDFNLGMAIGISLSCGLVVALLKMLSEIDYHKKINWLRRVFSKDF